MLSTGLICFEYTVKTEIRLFGYSSVSFDTAAKGTTPEIFRNRRARELRSLINQIYS